MKPVESYKELVAAADRQGYPMGFIEAQIMLGYMKGHDYQLIEDETGKLYRRDLAADDSDQDAYQPYTIRDALDFCIDMNEELLDLERKKDDPDTGYITQLEEDESILLELRGQYEAVNPYAVPYLTGEFPELSKNQARTVLSSWMKRKGAKSHEPQ